MPGGMSGTEFLCKVKDHYPDTITMILSAYTEPTYILDAMNKSRTFYYLTKPWEDKDLIESISEALKHYHAGFIRKERERHAHAIMIESEKMANLGNYV